MKYFLSPFLPDWNQWQSAAWRGRVVWLLRRIWPLTPLAVQTSRGSRLVWGTVAATRGGGGGAGGGDRGGRVLTSHSLLLQALWAYLTLNTDARERWPTWAGNQIISSVADPGASHHHPSFPDIHCDILDLNHWTTGQFIPSQSNRHPFIFF